MLAVGVSVSACTGAPTGAEADLVLQTNGAHGAHGAGATETGAATDEDSHEDHEDGHQHDDEVEASAPTTGPPRPADAALLCGTTVLPDGEQVTRYCDEGTASFVVGENKNTDVKGATCEDRGAFFLAHFGANYSDAATARGDYLGLALEEMPETAGQAAIYALELTVDGYSQAVSTATVDVTRTGDVVTLDVVGELNDGRSLSIAASCHTHES
jgi:hypothetical protein